MKDKKKKKLEVKSIIIIYSKVPNIAIKNVKGGLYLEQLQTMVWCGMCVEKCDNQDSSKMKTPIPNISYIFAGILSIANCIIHAQVIENSKNGNDDSV